MGQQVVVASPKLLQYGRLGEVFQGQVFELEGQRNDQLLLAPQIGYLRRLEREEEKDVETCVCGRKFISLFWRQGHMRDMPHDALDLDTPVKPRRQRGPNGRYLPIDPDGDSPAPLEPEGAPAAPPVGVGSMAAQRGFGNVQVKSDGRGGGSELFRMDGAPPQGI